MHLQLNPFCVTHILCHSNYVLCKKIATFLVITYARRTPGRQSSKTFLGENLENLDFHLNWNIKYRHFLQAINSLWVFYCLKMHWVVAFFYRFRHQKELSSISLYWGNLNFLQISFNYIDNLRFNNLVECPALLHNGLWLFCR